MKKKLALIMVLLAMMLMIAGCGNNGSDSGDEGQKDNKKYTLVSEIAEDGKSMSIIATKADEGDFTMAGSLIIEENEKVTSLPALNEGYITIELINSEAMGLDENASGEDLQNAGSTGADYTIKAEGTEITEVTPEPGDYYVKVTTGKGADGAVTLSVLPAE